MIFYALVCLLTISALGGRYDQDVQLYRYREAWAKTSLQHVKDSIRQEVLDAIPDLRVNNEHGQEQVNLWDQCCSLWDVVEIFGEAGSIDSSDLPSFSMRMVDGVAFYQSVNTMAPTRDTVFNASNRYPGFGGIDIYFAESFYYPAVGIEKWLGLLNIGQDVNTGADEFGLRREDSTYTFLRLINGYVRKYRATQRTVVKDVQVTTLCSNSNTVIMNVIDCRDAFISSVGFESGVRTTLPPTAKLLNFSCCGNKQPRVFVRCEVTMRALVLRDTDIRTHFCFHDGITTHAGGEQEFGFSVYENQLSAEAALQEIGTELLKSASPASTITVCQVPGHLQQPINELTRKCQLRGITVKTTISQDSRTTITLQHI